MINADHFLMYLGKKATRIIEPLNSKLVNTYDS